MAQPRRRSPRHRSLPFPSESLFLLEPRLVRCPREMKGHSVDLVLDFSEESKLPGGHGLDVVRHRLTGFQGRSIPLRFADFQGSTFSRINLFSRKKRICSLWNDWMAFLAVVIASSIPPE